MFYGENEAKNQGKKLQNQSGSVLGELKQKIQHKGIFHWWSWVSYYLHNSYCAWFLTRIFDELPDAL